MKRGPHLGKTQKGTQRAPFWVQGKKPSKPPTQQERKVLHSLLRHPSSQPPPPRHSNPPNTLSSPNDSNTSILETHRAFQLLLQNSKKFMFSEVDTGVTFEKASYTLVTMTDCSHSSLPKTLSNIEKLHCQGSCIASSKATAEEPIQSLKAMGVSPLSKPSSSDPPLDYNFIPPILLEAHALTAFGCSVLTPTL